MNLKEQLIELGWAEHECRFPVSDKPDLNARFQSPHIDDEYFWYENCLKQINSGEARYALEIYALELEHLTWRCNDKNPNNHHVLDTLDAFDLAREMMLEGIDYRKGHIQIIDWEHMERNKFEFVQGWRGAQNNGFAWNFVLLVNAIPVGAIVSGTSCQEALDQAQQELDQDFQFPVYCHSLLLTDGEQVLMGQPWMELEDFQTVKTPSEELQPVAFLKKQIKDFD